MQYKIVVKYYLDILPQGAVLGFVLGTIGRRVLERAFENSVKAIEVRNSAASGA
jgi:hypothetical protein